MSRLTRNGTAEPVSRDQLLRRDGDSEIIIFPVNVTTSRIVNLTRLINTPPQKSGGIRWVSTRSGLSEENEQADAGRDGRTSLARPNTQARTGTAK